MREKDEERLNTKKGGREREREKEETTSIACNFTLTFFSEKKRRRRGKEHTTILFQIPFFFFTRFPVDTIFSRIQRRKVM